MLVKETFIHKEDRTALYHHLYSNAPKQIVDRGAKIYQKGSYHYDGFDDEIGIHEFKVLGKSDLYFVTVALEEDDVVSTCTCPYDEDTLCKHQVAAILALVKKAGSRSEHPSEIQAKPNKKQPKAPSSREIVLEQVRRNQDYPITPQADVRIDSVAPGRAEVDVRLHESYYWRYSRPLQEARLSIEVADNEINISCDCSKARQNNCLHYDEFLRVLGYAQLEGFFDQLTRVDEIRQQFMEMFGVKNEKTFDKEFHPQLMMSGLGFMPHDTSIMPLSQYVDWEGSFLEPVLHNEASDYLRSGVSIVSQDVSREFEYGYGLLLCPPGFPQPCSLIPMKGKLNKNGTKLISRFEALDSSPVPELAHACQQLPAGSARYRDANEVMLPMDESDEDLPLYYSILEKAFPALAEQKHVLRFTKEGKPSNNRLEPLAISTEPVELIFEFRKEKKNYHCLEAFVKMPGETIPLRAYPHDVHELLFLHNGTLYRQRSAEQAHVFSFFLGKPETRVPSDDWENFYSKVVQPLSKRFPVELQLGKRQIKETSGAMKEQKLYLRELDQYILFEPIVEYDEGEVPLLEKGDIQYLDNGKVHKISRDEEQEQDYLNWLLAQHHRFAERQHLDLLSLSYKEMMEDQWFLKFFDSARQQGVTILGLNDLKNFRYNTHSPTISMSVSSGIDWLDASVEISFGDQTASLKDVKKAIHRGDKFVTLGDGSIGMLPEEWLNKLAKYMRIGHVKDDKLQVSKLHFSVIDELFEDVDDEALQKELAERKQLLHSFDEIEQTKLPKKLKADLREYQVAGYNWLHFLHKFGFGGILADDMGLGKTVQALSFLLSIRGKKSDPPHLVIAPKTLVFNWEAEAEKFTPSLKVHIHHGHTRQKDTKGFKDYDIILTTYGTMTRDIDWLKEQPFRYVILDESQAIKNPQSKRYKAARLLQAENRLTLTGTPIENHTFDLYAQMNFVNPGFFGSQKHFREQYALPVDKEQSKERAGELRQLVKPFLLRRTKEQVEQELPDKTEDVLYCEMEKDQRKVYDAMRNKYRDYVLGKIEEEGIENSKMYVLEGLTKLRQICNSPALLPDEEDYGDESVKADMLVEHINEKTGSHKLLVFSQFVKMLKLLEERFKEQGVSYAYLDGSTNNRKEEVARFQEQEDCRVFLISLKAGGTGLNLTAADYVYVVDPWWNPAVEQQAIDRTHRIGQSKHVFAYKLICKDTVEEKIQQLKERKLQVAGEIIQTEDNFFKQLKKEDVKGLFG